MILIQQKVVVSNAYTHVCLDSVHNYEMDEIDSTNIFQWFTKLEISIKKFMFETVYVLNGIPCMAIKLTKNVTVEKRTNKIQKKQGFEESQNILCSISSEHCNDINSILYIQQWYQVICFWINASTDKQIKIKLHKI